MTPKEQNEISGNMIILSTFFDSKEEFISYCEHEMQETLIDEFEGVTFWNMEKQWGWGQATSLHLQYGAECGLNEQLKNLVGFDDFIEYAYHVEVISK